MKKTPLQVYLDDRDRKLLTELASREGLSLAETLRAAVRRWATETSASDDPLLKLVGSVDDPTLPVDLSTRHDAHAVAREAGTPSGKTPSAKTKRKRRER